MFKNYFLSAVRSFGRIKLFSLINVLGLAIGISASLVGWLIVQYEFSYDTIQQDRERIYRVVTNIHYPGRDFKNSGVPAPLAVAMRDEIPGIETSTLFLLVHEMKVEIPTKHENKGVFMKQKLICFADDQYFNIINYEWLAGSVVSALLEPNKVVLTESRVREYFGYADVRHAIGQTIIYDDSLITTVSGVIKDQEQPTDLASKEFVSIPTYIDQFKSDGGWYEWGNVNSATQFLVKLRKGVDPKWINNQLAELREKHKKDASLKTDYFLQPLSDIHLNAELNKS